MADYPCDLHLERYRGPSSRAFLSVYRDDQVLSLRLSVCEPCLELVLEPWAARAFYRASEKDWDPLEEGQDLAGLWRPQPGRSDGPRGRGR